MWWLRWLDPPSCECRILGCQEQILYRPQELGFGGHTSGPYLLPCLVVEWAGLQVMFWCLVRFSSGSVNRHIYRQLYVSLADSKIRKWEATKTRHCSSTQELLSQKDYMYGVHIDEVASWRQGHRLTLIHCLFNVQVKQPECISGTDLHPLTHIAPQRWKLPVKLAI